MARWYDVRRKTGKIVRDEHGLNQLNSRLHSLAWPVETDMLRIRLALAHPKRPQSTILGCVFALCRWHSHGRPMRKTQFVVHNQKL